MNGIKNLFSVIVVILTAKNKTIYEGGSVAVINR